MRTWGGILGWDILLFMSKCEEYHHKLYMYIHAFISQCPPWLKTDERGPPWLKTDEKWMDIILS